MTATSTPPRLSPSLGRYRALRHVAYLLPGNRALRLARLQAHALRRDAARVGLTPDEYVGTLPPINIDCADEQPVGVLSYWSHKERVWVIRLRIPSELRNANRRRILHEFKRILDRPLTHHLYSPEHEESTVTARAAAEAFAIEALMPRREFRRTFRAGSDTPELLAARFEVTIEQAAGRIHELGLAQKNTKPERRES